MTNPLFHLQCFLGVTPCNAGQEEKTLQLMSSLSSTQQWHHMRPSQPARTLEAAYGNCLGATGDMQCNVLVRIICSVQ